jgi:endonuclease-3
MDEVYHSGVAWIQKRRLLPLKGLFSLTMMMPLKERVEYIDRELERLYPNPPIPLHHRDAFTLLVAVVLSAQCTDARVNLVTPGLFALADNPAAMAALGEARILEAIKSCGLAPSKAKAIAGLSAILVEKHGGMVPDNFEDLEALPGVGHKTASVVMTQFFGVPAFPVDTHIHRLAARWRLSKARNIAETEHDLKKRFPRERWHDLHLQIIYYGREHCTARGCDGHRCGICAAVNGARK